MTTTIVNCTPHTINILGLDGKPLLVLPPSGVTVRALMTTDEVGEINGVPIRRSRVGSVDLPEPIPGNVYIVSLIAAQAAKELGRDDIYIVDGAVRNEQGQIIGVTGLAQL